MKKNQGVVLRQGGAQQNNHYFAQINVFPYFFGSLFNSEEAGCENQQHEAFEIGSQTPKWGR